jgi:hypothetical protein
VSSPITKASPAPSSVEPIVIPSLVINQLLTLTPVPVTGTISSLDTVDL